MTDTETKAPELPLMGPTMGSIPKPPATATPFFINGADDRPLDTRIIAVAVYARAEIKVGDREFSCAMGLHEIVTLRHYYDARAGSGTIRLAAGWPPGLARERGLTHQDLLTEARRMASTYLVPKPSQQIVRSFDAFFGSEPTEQLKRLHAVMREQYEAWRALLSKAMGRLPADTAGLHPEMRLSMAFDLITEREIEEIALMSDPSRRGLDVIQLDEVFQQTTPVAAPEKPLTFDEVRLQAEKAADAEDQMEPPTPGELAVQALLAKGFDQARAADIGALVDQYGAGMSDEDLVRAAGSKGKADQARAALSKILKLAH